MIATRIGSGRARTWGLAFAMAAGLAQAEDDSALHARYSKAVRAAMGGAAQLSVPLDVSAGYGRTWQEAAH